MRATLPAIAVLLALAIPVQAHDCTNWTTTTPDATVPATDDTAQQYLIVLECGGPDCWPISFVWWYEESNGIPGLQRGDEMVDDTCHGMIDADTIIF